MRSVFSWVLVLGGLSIAGGLPARADVTPDAALEVHVQTPAWNCDSPITHCDDIEGSALALGQVEFLLYFQPIYWQQSHQPVRLSSLHTELHWPDAWQLLDADGCSADWGQLDWTGSPHALTLEWWDCPNLPIEDGGVFLMARFVFNATEPGRFWAEYHNGSTVTLGCPPTTVQTYPVFCFAELGEDCEYTRFHCGYLPPCSPFFPTESLELSAPPGASAVASTEVNGIDLCWSQVQLDTTAPWLSAVHKLVEHDYFDVTLTADATGLEPGLYTARLRAHTMWISRCLPVEFRVLDPTGVTPPPGAELMSWSRVKSLYR
ncbi:MAG: hypothetical protein R3C71_05675 [Candidatus Krumholzibacteriia bacterium]